MHAIMNVVTIIYWENRITVTSFIAVQFFLFVCCRLSLPLLLVELPMYVCHTQSVVLYVYYIIPEIDTNRVVSYDSYCNAKPFESDNHTYVHM